MDILTIAQREADKAYEATPGSDYEKSGAYLETVRATRKRGYRAETLLEAGAVSRDGGPGKFYVKSQSGNGRYHVDVTAGSCTCPDYQHRGAYCKHLQAAELFQDQAQEPKAEATEATDDIYTLAKEIVESESQWYSGQSRTVWEGNGHRVVVTEYGRDGGGLLGLQIINGRKGEKVQCGFLNILEGNEWQWTLTRSDYSDWAEKAKAI